MFRTYVAMGLLALGIFTHAQYTGYNVFATEQERPVAGRSSASHK